MCLERNENLEMSSFSPEKPANGSGNETTLLFTQPPQRAQTLSRDQVQRLLCRAVVVVRGRCWMKREGNISVRTYSPAVSFVLGLRSIPLTTKPHSSYSVLYGVLTEHHYVDSRMIPSLQTWLRDEDVSIFLDESTPAIRKRSETVLEPFLRRRRDPSTVRVIQYLYRDSLKDVLRRIGRITEVQHKMLEQLEQLERVGPRMWERLPQGSVERANQVKELARRHFSGSNQNLLDIRFERPEFRLAGASGAWKDLPGLDVLFRQFKNFSFYVLIDDDSYVIQRNFRIALSSFYLTAFNPMNDPLFFGVLTAWYQGGSKDKKFPPTVTPFIQGGAGIVMSNAAVSKVFPHLNTHCRLRCDFLPHGDVRLGCCMIKHRVTPSVESSLWHMHVYRAQGRDRRQDLSLFPSSFHRMKNMSMMEELQACETDAVRRLDAQGAPEAQPVSWADVMGCYAWIWGGPDEYKFHMKELH
jgi:hypothetical protein